MAQYYVTVGKQEYKVAITEAGLFLNDEPVQGDLVSLNRTGLHQLSRERQSLEVHLSAQSRHTYEVLIGGRRVIARVAPWAGRGRRPQERAPAGAVTALMPGLIVEVRVRAGERVGKGDVLVVQEAMKMQMELRAPYDGYVERVAVEAGAQVEKGVLLALLTARDQEGT